MQKLLDKAVLLVLCLVLLFIRREEFAAVAALLTAVTLSALNTYLGHARARWLSLGYLGLCAVWGEFLLFLPLLAYDLAVEELWPLRVSWIVPLLVQMGRTPPLLLFGAAALSGAALLLSVRTRQAAEGRASYHRLQDSAKESALHLEEKNRELMEKQDYEVRLATLNERNRIAREIHDNVGHLLTRSILQVSALQVVARQEEDLCRELAGIRESLSTAMDSIRRSVHDLHEESIDLRVQLLALTEAFEFCPVKLRYDAGDLPKELKYCFIAVTREALSNIARHSNATQAEVTVLEHPALVQLMVRDNGTRRNIRDSAGIGLENMRDRVEAFHGVFRAEHAGDGFRIFISIPKEEEKG